MRRHEALEAPGGHAISGCGPGHSNRVWGAIRGCGGLRLARGRAHRTCHACRFRSALSVSWATDSSNELAGVKPRGRTGRLDDRDVVPTSPLLARGFRTSAWRRSAACCGCPCLGALDVSSISRDLDRARAEGRRERHSPTGADVQPDKQWAQLACLVPCAVRRARGLYGTARCAGLQRDRGSRCKVTAVIFLFASIQGQHLLLIHLDGRSSARSRTWRFVWTFGLGQRKISSAPRGYRRPRVLVGAVPDRRRGARARAGNNTQLDRGFRSATSEWGNGLRDPARSTARGALDEIDEVADRVRSSTADEGGARGHGHRPHPCARGAPRWDDLMAGWSYPRAVRCALRAQAHGVRGVDYVVKRGFECRCRPPLWCY